MKIYTARQKLSASNFSSIFLVCSYIERSFLGKLKEGRKISRIFQTRSPFFRDSNRVDTTSRENALMVPKKASHVLNGLSILVELYERKHLQSFMFNKRVKSMCNLSKQMRYCVYVTILFRPGYKVLTLTAMLMYM